MNLSLLRTNASPEPGDWTRAGERLAAVPAMVWEIHGSPDGLRRLDFVGGSTECLLGYPIEAWLGRPSIWSHVIDARDRLRVTERLSRVFATGEPAIIQFRTALRPEDRRRIEIHVSAMTASNGRTIGLRGLMIDVTRRQRRFHRRLADTGFVGIIFWDFDGQITDANDAFLELIGYSPDECPDDLKWDELTPHEHRHRDRQAFAELAAGGTTAPYEKEFVHRNGRRVSVLTAPALLDDAPGKGITYVFDVTRYKRRVEEQGVLADLSQRTLQSDLASCLHFAAQAITNVLQADGCRILLREPGGLRVAAGEPIESSSAAVDATPESQTSTTTVAIVDEETLGVLEVQIPSARQLSAEEQTFLQAAANVLASAVRHKRSSDAIAVKEQHLAENLRLEALGRLAGGIAHDFNNLLTAILGYADLAAGRDPECRGELDEICRAASSAAELVRQLLAFSRRQTLQPRRIDLCATIAGVERMLRRLIGEDIKFICRPLAEPVLIAADPAQIEQVVMNLVLNARDAIKGEGTIAVSLARTVVMDAGRSAPFGIKPGAYAVLTVSDTGEGMDEETRSRIFEPFFTTKKLGHGTGLGLATVHGIVHQSGGSISVCSEPGSGSVFIVHLPLDEQPQALATVPIDAPVYGRETVLLVDDDPGVRGSLAPGLRRLGYDVMTAASPREAIEMASSVDHPIDALLTDIVMPSMSGVALADRVRGAVPGIRTLFMSGYPEGVVLENGLAPDQLITKPFTCRALAGRLRQAFDARVVTERR